MSVCVCVCARVCLPYAYGAYLCAYAYTASYNYKITGTISINRLNFDTFFSRSKNRPSQINVIECSIVIEYHAKSREVIVCSGYKLIVFCDNRYVWAGEIPIMTRVNHDI